MQLIYFLLLNITKTSLSSFSTNKITRECIRRIFISSRIRYNFEISTADINIFDICQQQQMKTRSKDNVGDISLFLCLINRKFLVNKRLTIDDNIIDSSCTHHSKNYVKVFSSRYLTTQNSENSGLLSIMSDSTRNPDIKCYHL